MFENKYANIKLCILSLYNLKRQSILPRHLWMISGRFTFAPPLDFFLSNHKPSRGISNIFKLGFTVARLKNSATFLNKIVRSMQT